MTALFLNLKIDKKEKFNLFKITLADIECLFNECHIKIRGELANECIIFAKELFSDRATFYQELQENDWIATTLVMINNVKSRSIFFYLEDHKLTSSPDDLNLVLKEFDEHISKFFSDKNVNAIYNLELKNDEFSFFNMMVKQRSSPLYPNESFKTFKVFIFYKLFFVEKYA